MSAVLRERHWPASLRLLYSGASGKTLLLQRRHRGPLTVQKPFYPENAACHTYILHPPGGIASGDDLHLNLTLEQSAHTLATTPASGKFYRSDGNLAHLHQEFHVDGNSLLEWLPQENIVFDGARVEQSSRFHLTGAARLVAWEINCFGRPACNESWAPGAMDQRLEVWRDGRPLLVERNLLDKPNIMNAPWGMAGRAVSGLMVVAGADQIDIAGCRDGLQTQHGTAALTMLDDLLVVRYLGDKTDEAKRCFTTIWARVRPAMAGCPVCIPRIWHT